MEILLSVVIPSYGDKYLQSTIDSLLENSQLGDQLEVIVVLDNKWPDTPLKNDKRVRIIHRGTNGGMRRSINTGVAVARGKFIGRCDEHIMFSPGYDKVLVESCGEKDMMTGRRYFLNVKKWEIMKELPPIDCEKLVIQDCGNGIRKFAGQRWSSRAKKFKNEQIIEAQAQQGSFWCTSRKNWDNSIIELETDGYGPHYGDSHEALFKTWKNGGKLFYNKNMWYAHKHRSFPRTHNNGSPENPAKAAEGWMYSLSVWEDYYKNEILPMWKNK